MPATPPDGRAGWHPSGQPPCACSSPGRGYRLQSVGATHTVPRASRGWDAAKKVNHVRLVWADDRPHDPPADTARRLSPHSLSRKYQPAGRNRSGNRFSRAIRAAAADAMAPRSLPRTGGGFVRVRVAITSPIRVPTERVCQRAFPGCDVAMIVPSKITSGTAGGSCSDPCHTLVLTYPPRLAPYRGII